MLQTFLSSAILQGDEPICKALSAKKLPFMQQSGSIYINRILLILTFLL